MFYLEGEGLELFKPIVGHEDSKRGTEVYVYQVDLEKF
jgi:hypothetical protein